MTKPTSLETVLTMTEDELVELNGKLKKRLAIKMVVGVITSVAVHFAAEFLIRAIDSKKAGKAELTE